MYFQNSAFFDPLIAAFSFAITKKHMFFGLLFTLLLVAAVVLVAVFGISPANVATDIQSPLNMVMFQQPSHRYSDQLVNLWIEKPWRSDGKRLPCRIEKGYDPEVPTSERTLVLYSHGNAEDLMYCAQFLRELAHKLGVDVMSWDYSGYGLNDTDKNERSMKGINLSLKTILDEMTSSRQGYRMDNIVMWGYSLGSGPTVALAAELCRKETPPAAVVLFGAYSSIIDVVKDKVGDKVASFFDARWDNAFEIQSVSCPVLIMHGQSDGLIGYHHAEKLKKSQPQAKMVLLPNTGHTQFSWGDAIKEVKGWLDQEQLILQRI